MENRGRVVPGGTARSPESALASELFDQFISAGTFKSVLATYRQICEVLRLKPTNFTNFYPRLKAKLPSWRAASLWAKLDKRASHKCYNRGKACPNTRVLIIGAGPCGLRAAIETQLLGAKVVVVEKRDRFSRNNVLHLWPFVIHDLRSLGAKKFFGKFCAGSIDHISIRQLQIILLKVALILGVEVHENVGFESLIEPLEDQTNERVGWHARVSPPDHPVSLYEFDALIGADGKRNTLLGFNRKEFRGKLAIAVTANFINRHTIEEARVPEISGVAFIFNQKFFQDMREQTAIDLENIVYYKDDTHYFVMTAKKQSLLERGVIIRDYNDTARLLAPENVDREALMEYARDAADFATNYQLPSLDFAVNHYGQADVAMFDFTSMYAAENACRLIERRGHKLLQGLVGDSLLEPFWPTGSGCARGFLSSFDAAWMIRSLASGRLSTLQVLAERESIYRLLAQTTPENLSKDLNQYTLNPSTRYPNLNLQAVLPSQVRSLFETDGKVEENILDVAAEVPKKKRRKESMIHPDTLLNWCRKQVALNDKIKIQDFTTSWKDGLALCAILHRYRPDLIDLCALDPENIAKNNQLAFDICERELGIPPIMTGQEMADCDVPDKLTMVSYISQVYESFRGEIPVVLSKAIPTEERIVSPNRLHSTPLSILNRISSKLQNKRKYSIEKELSKERERGENIKRRSTALLTHKRRSRERGVALDMNNQAVLLTDYKSTGLSKPRESINTRVKNLEDKMKRDAGLRCHATEESDSMKAARVRSEQTEMSIKLLQEQLQKNGSDANVKKSRTPKVGKLRKDEWNVKIIEEKIKQQNSHVKRPSAEKPKILKDIFVSKLQQMDDKLKAGGSLTPEEAARYKKFDDSLHKLKDRLSKGNLNAGERGHNQTAVMTDHMAKIWDRKAGRKKDPIPPAPVFKVTVETDSSSTSAGSEICYFCKKRVYLMERLSAEGLFFHRSCFKCEYCSASLRLGNYSFDRDAICGGKFYCTPHFRMQKPDHRWQEMMKRKQAFLSCALEEQEKEKLYKTLLDNTEKALSPQRQADSSSPAKSSVETVDRDNKDISSPNLLAEPASPFGRDQTPERVEYENSIIELSEEELLTSELEEEELTQKNLGPCQDLATSEDEYSDLSTDTESDEEAFAEELERSLTADETRKLAETWNRKYSVEHSLMDSISSSSADDEESDTEIGTDDTSDDIDSDAEYSVENSEEDGALGKKEVETQDAQVMPVAKECFTVEVPIIDLKSMNKASEDETTSESDISEELTDSEDDVESETGTEVDSESDSKPSIPPLIPTIVIHESPPQDVDLDQQWDENAPSKDIKQTEESVIMLSETSDLEPGESSIEKVESILDKSDSTPAVLDANEDGKFNILENADKDVDSLCSRKENELFKEFDQLESVVQSVAPLAVEESSSDLSISSGINSLAKEIVTDVMQAAKYSVIENETSVEVTGMASEEKKNPDNSDSTPNSASTSSVSASGKWLRLESTPSSEEAKVQLIDLCSPEQASGPKILSSQSNTEIEIIDLCSPSNTPPSVNKQTDSCFVLKNEIEDISSSQFPESVISIPEDKGSFDDLKIDNEKTQFNITLDEENIENKNVPLNNSLSDKISSPCDEVLDESPEDFKFDSTFVTFRKKKRHSSDSDVFNWESDTSITLPCTYKEDSINVDDDFSYDGIYHANVVQAVGACPKAEDKSSEQILFCGTTNLPKELSQSCESTLPRVSKPGIAHSIQDSIDNSKHLPNEMPFDKSSLCMRDPDLLNNAKSNKLVPKNEVLPEESNLSLKGSKSSDDALHSDNEVHDENDGNFDHACINMSNSVMSTSLTETRSVSTPQNSPKDGLKYKGYSGSFAEKIRPKSLFCDTIYLRSLDIKLQKQPFSSLNKSDDKLDDCSKTGCNDKIRKKLFDDNNRSSKLISKQSAMLNEIEKNNLNSSAIQKACLKSSPASNDASQKILNSGLCKPKSSGHKHSSVSFSAPESHCDLVSPYTCAQIKPSEEMSFPTKMKPKCDMDINKLRQKREKRKSVHEDIQGLPFADEEKIVSPVDPFGSTDVFATPNSTFDSKAQSSVSSSEDVFSTPVGKTPDLIDEERYLRLQSTAEQEKARQEARARARLKSDEELGLSPNNYRKKYRRQLSLNSINYDELCSDEFCDQDEELEDDIIINFCQKKNSGIEETFTMLKNSDLCFKAKTSDPPVNSSQVLQQNDAEVLPIICDLSPSNISPFVANVPVLSDKLDINIQQNVGISNTLKQATKHSSKNSSSETSPEVFSSDASPFNTKYHKGKLKSGRSESCGDDDKTKSNGKKSIFSILNFGKGNVSKEKVKQKSGKDLSSSLPNDIDSRTTSKSKPFSHLKLAKSKEKIHKPKAKSAPPEDVSETPPVETFSTIEEPSTHSVNTYSTKIIPKYTVYRNPETMISTFPVHLPVPKLENGLAPKASEDSFSDEDDTQGSKLGHIPCLDRNEKNSNEKEKKAQRIVEKVQKQQVLKRLRNAQEIQRRLEELEIQQKELEQQGVEFEKIHRGERHRDGNIKGEAELMQEWYTLVHSKNKLMREEQELMIRLKDLELEDRHSKLQQDMRERLAHNAHKDPTQIMEEGKILSEMLEIVEKRDELVAMLEQLRLREVEEEKNLNSEVFSKGMKSPLSPGEKS